MGELFAHFEGWDVQAIRKESREQALIEARKQVEREMEEARKEVAQRVTQQVTQQVTESDVQKLLAVLYKPGCPRETAIEQLMEQYQLSQEIATAKVGDLGGGEKYAINPETINKSYQFADIVK